MEAFWSLFYSGGTEGTTGFLLPYQQQQQQQTTMGWPYNFPARPMQVPPLGNSLAYPSASMYQYMANFNVQPGATPLQQHTAFLLNELAHRAFLLNEWAKAQVQRVQLEASLMRANEEREHWQRIASEYGAVVASLQQQPESAVGSSPDAGALASLLRRVQLQTSLMRANEEREHWQRIANEHEAMVASLQQQLESSVGSSPDMGALASLRQRHLESSVGPSPDVGAAASSTGHPLAAEEPREGTGIEPWKCGE